MSTTPVVTPEALPAEEVAEASAPAPEAEVDSPDQVHPAGDSSSADSDNAEVADPDRAEAQAIVTMVGLIVEELLEVIDLELVFGSLQTAVVEIGEQLSQQLPDFNALVGQGVEDLSSRFWAGFPGHAEIVLPDGGTIIVRAHLPGMEKRMSAEDLLSENAEMATDLAKAEKGRALLVTDEVTARLKRGEKRHIVPRFDEGSTYVTAAVGVALGVGGTLLVQSLVGSGEATDDMGVESSDVHRLAANG